MCTWSEGPDNNEADKVRDGVCGRGPCSLAPVLAGPKSSAGEACLSWYRGAT